MSSKDVLWERDLGWYAHLEQRDEEDEYQQDESDGGDESQTSTTQTKTSTASKKNSASLTASVTSVSSPSTTLVNAITSASSISSQATTLATTAPVTSTTSASVKSTFITSTSPTPASIFATEEGKENASSISSKAVPTATAVAEDLSPSSHSNTSNKTTINIAVGVGATTLLLLALLLFIFRNPIKSFFKKRMTSRTDATRSIWRGESMMTTAAAPAPDLLRQIYIPPRNMRQQSTFLPPLTLSPDHPGGRRVSVNTVMRQERLELVRDLPPSRDLDIEVTREVQQMTKSRKNIGIVQGSGTLDEKGRFEARASAGVWKNAEMAAKRESEASSEASVRRWRTPVSWVRDQRRRGWGRLSG